MPKTKDEMIEEITEQFRGFVDKMFRIGEASLAEELLLFLDDSSMDEKSRTILTTFLHQKSKEFLNQ